jgi:hypothetical protein
MVKYIIKIDCTHITNLSFNGINIRLGKKKTRYRRKVSQCPPDLTLGYISCIFPYIKSIKIIHKKLNNFTRKTLEFYCESESDLSSEEFIDFIEVLKKIGFSSHDNKTVRYVKIINYYEETILRHEHVDIIIYTFTSLERIQPIFRTPRIRRNPNSRYKYRTELLNICKNLTV